jgi:hypothetical protein
VTTMTAEIAVSGSAAGQRVRGRLLAGVASPTSARIEAVAPFGQPLFIFVSRNDDATLLLPRDDRVLEHGRPAAVLDAIAGIPLDAPELRSTLTGCASAPDPSKGQQAGDTWRVVPDGAGEDYLQREANARWRLVARTHLEPGRAWRVEYRDFVDDLPRTIRLVSLNGEAFNLTLKLSQVETNVALDAEAFRVKVPPGAQPITVEELRRSGPLSRKTSEP